MHRAGAFNHGDERRAFTPLHRHGRDQGQRRKGEGA